MDHTTFEHTIFAKVGDYLEHCRKQLQTTSAMLLQELDSKLKGLIVIFAFDTAKQSEQVFIACPNDEWISKLFSPHLGKLAELFKVVELKSRFRNHGTVLNITPPIIQPTLRLIAKEALNNGITVAYSTPILTGSFAIFSSIWFQSVDYQSYYMLAPREQGVCSLLDSSVKQLMDNAHTFMLGKLSQEGLLHVSPVSPDYILNKAGAGLLARVAMYLPKEAAMIPQEIETIKRSVTLFDDLNRITKMRYEGAEASGNLLIGDPAHPNIRLLMEFTTPIWSHNHRQVRKLLEVARNGTYLLCFKGDIYGIGYKEGLYNISTESLFEIEIVEHATWRLKHGDEVMMVVRYDQPSLNVEQKHTYLDRLEERLKTQFPALLPVKGKHLRSLVEMAMEQQHGTMLVITDHAKEEADRLEKQSIHVTPTLIINELMKLVTAIDGAVLLDIDGYCYAIGVILDGIVEAGEGDPSRGARYHAALKYLSYSRRSGHKCLIVVISEDGVINIFPE